MLTSKNMFCLICWFEARYWQNRPRYRRVTKWHRFFRGRQSWYSHCLVQVKTDILDSYRFLLEGRSWRLLRTPVSRRSTRMKQPADRWWQIACRTTPFKQLLFAKGLHCHQPYTHVAMPSIRVKDFSSWATSGSSPTRKKTTVSHCDRTVEYG